jgi:hypothetical protein
MARIIPVPSGEALVISVAEIIEKYELSGQSSISLPPRLNDTSVLNAREFFEGS